MTHFLQKFIASLSGRDNGIEKHVQDIEGHHEEVKSALTRVRGRTDVLYRLVSEMRDDSNSNDN